MRPLLVPLSGIIVGRSLMVASLLTFLPTFLTEQGANVWFAGTSVSIMSGAGIIGALLGGWLSDRLGRRLVLFTSMLASPLLMLTFLGVEGWARLPVLVLMGFAGPSIRTVLMALTQESYPDNRALANGAYLALSFTLEAGAAVVVGAMGDLFGLGTAFTASAAVALLGLPLILLLPRKQGAGLTS
jgi:FSR family fosmidomycin resistance protein-like MFS transporter